MNRYCKKCGENLEKFGSVIEFNPVTGEPVYEKRCPKNPCHQGHKMKPIEYDKSLFRKYCLGEYKCKCSICGKEEYHQDD